MRSEESYGSPYSNGATLELLARAGDRQVNTLNRTGDAQLDTQREFWRTMQNNVDKAKDAYDKSYDRAYTKERDDQIEGRNREQHQAWLDTNKASLDKATMENRRLAAEEQYLNEVGPDAKPRWQTERQEKRDREAQEYQLNQELTRSSIAANRAQMGLSSAQAKQALSANELAQAQVLREQAANDMAVAAGQMNEAQTELQSATLAGNQRGMQLASAKLNAAQQQMAQASAFYKTKGLADFDIQAAQGQGAKLYNQGQQTNAQIWKLQGEGQGYDQAKAAVDEKIAAYRSLVSEANKYREAAALGKDASVSRDNMQHILETKLGKPGEAEVAGYGYSFIPQFAGGGGFFDSGNAKVSRVVQNVEKDINDEISGLEARYGKAPPLAIRQEIDGLKAALKQIAQQDTYGRKDTIQLNRGQGQMIPTMDGVSRYRTLMQTPVTGGQP